MCDNHAASGGGQCPTAYRHSWPGGPRTKIICTLGPATSSDTRIRALLRAGMSVARLNLAHGSPESQAEIVSRVRAQEAKLRIPVGILADVPGPKYRVGAMKGGGVRLKRGQPFQLVAAPMVGDAATASIEPSGLHADVGPGDRVLIDDGLVEMEVTGVEGDAVACRVVNNGLLRSGKGVATPGKAPSMPYLTPDTKEALRFVAEHDVDYVGLSCVRSLLDIQQARSTLEALGAHPGIVVKIERQVGAGPSGRPDSSRRCGHGGPRRPGSGHPPGPGADGPDGDHPGLQRDG